MIKNVVFDLGGVLIDYKPKDYLRSFGYDEEKIVELFEHIFDNPLWKEFDRGTYTIAEGIKILESQKPEHNEDVIKILCNDWVDILLYKEKTGEFLKKLKQEGYQLYVLSNFPIEAFEFIEKKYDFFKLFDGKIVSGYINLIKPDIEIYTHMLETFGILPEETVFIDDLQSNLDAANSIGINTILFTDIEEVESKFDSIK